MTAIARAAALPTLIACGLLCTAPPAAADLYKWVDEKGVTHYSDNAPPDGKAKKIEVKPVPPSSVARPLSLEELKDREFELRQRRLDQEKTDVKAQREAAARQQRCLRAQREMDLLGRARPVYTVNERGERVYIGDKERTAEMDRWKKIAEASCGR